MARRLRATRVAAAAPNSRTIGGAGTGTPPLELDEEPPLEEAELAEEALDALEALEADDPKLLDPPVAPLLEALLAEDAEEALLAELPELPVLVLELSWGGRCGRCGRSRRSGRSPPEALHELDLELALLAQLALLALDEPPVEVEVEPPEVEVEPPDVETVIVVLPPVELPPTKLPLKKPAPKPLPKPEPPPITIGTPPLALLATATGGGGGAGMNIGGTMVRVVVTCGAGAAQATRRTVRRTTRRCLDRARRTGTVRAFAWLTRVGRGGGFSIAWTAPPPMIAPPQVQAQSFARAILTDMISILFLAGLNKAAMQYSCAAWPEHRCKSLRFAASALTFLCPETGVFWGVRATSVPLQNRLAGGVKDIGRSSWPPRPSDWPERRRRRPIRDSPERPAVQKCHGARPRAEKIFLQVRVTCAGPMTRV